MKSSLFLRIVEFVFPQRLNPFHFLVRTLLLCNAYVLLWIYAFSTFYARPVGIFFAVLAGFVVSKVYYAGAIFAPRLRDMGESGWFALLVLFPYAFLFLAVVGLPEGALSVLLLLIPCAVLFSLVVGCVLPTGWSTGMRAKWARQRALSSPLMPQESGSRLARRRVMDEY